jgi:hypothetical protein
MEFHAEPFKRSLTKYICGMLTADLVAKQCQARLGQQNYYAE